MDSPSVTVVTDTTHSIPANGATAWAVRHIRAENDAEPQPSRRAAV